MKYIITYLIFYFISIYYLIKMSDDYEEEITKRVPYNAYLFVLVVINLFLVGFYFMLKEAIHWVRMQIIIIPIRIFVWKIKRKYKIK